MDIIAKIRTKSKQAMTFRLLNRLAGLVKQ